MFKFLVFLARLLYLPLFRIKVEGLENVKEVKGGIFYANHRSNNDPVVISVVTGLRFKVMAKSELFKIRIFNPVLRWIGAYPVYRGTGDFGAVDTAVDALKNGENFLLFPEGTRNDEGGLLRFMPGLASVALRTGAPLYMVAFSGKLGMFRKTTIRFFPKQDISEFTDKTEPTMKNILETSRALHDRLEKALGEFDA
jgi:1-acyl-sn-glycerol-3-phosphate acyltransferase